MMGTYWMRGFSKGPCSAEVAFLQFLRLCGVNMCDIESGSSVGIVTMLRDSVPDRGTISFLFQNVQTSPGAHLASYSRGTVGCLSSEVKRPGLETDHSPLFTAVVWN